MSGRWTPNLKALPYLVTRITVVRPAPPHMTATSATVSACRPSGAGTGGYASTSATSMSASACLAIAARPENSEQMR